ncbi:MAG TPA: hypothetical protein DD671_11795, partial [Balneolaceae bacterium]|nr:hypothetical protein [Balneolaceae bacterium]
NSGMRCVAVTTGKYDREELEEHGPDLVIDNLAQPEKWLNEINKNGKA